MGLKRVRAGFTGSDADGLLDWANEYLSVTNLIGLCSLDDGFNGPIDLIVIQNNFDFHLGQEIDNIFGSAV